MSQAIPGPYDTSSAPSSDISWVRLLESHMDGGSIVSTNDTLKSYAVDGAGRLTMTFKTVSATRNGHRETSGRSIPITDILADFLPTTHDILVYMNNPSSSGINIGIGIALVENAGAAGDGVGMFITSNRCSSQSVTSTPSAVSDATLSEGYGRFTITTNQVSVDVYRKTGSSGGEFISNLNSSGSFNDAVDPDNLEIFIQAMTYSGTAAEDNTAIADIAFAAVPKIASPF